jgi:hypothetical protein
MVAHTEVTMPYIKLAGVWILLHGIVGWVMFNVTTWANCHPWTQHNAYAWARC